MPYYIRVLGTSNPTITVDSLNAFANSSQLNVSIQVEEGTDYDWKQLVVKDKSNAHLFVIEKDEVVEGNFGQEEIDEFKEAIRHSKPVSASEWLLEYLDKVKVIFAFQLLNAVDNDERWNIVGEIKNKIWKATGGIVQADGEGFTNEDGYHILWHFSDNVTGSWAMAVRDSSNKFIKFMMDLGDKKQRQEFLDGKVPKGVDLI